MISVLRTCRHDFGPSRTTFLLITVTSRQNVEGRIRASGAFME